MNKVCFIISSIGEQGSRTRILADEKYDLVFAPFLRELNYEPVRADKETIPNMISRGIVNRIINSDLVVADISDNNPNVFYELAIRNAVKKPVIIIKRHDQVLPFDIADMRAISLDMTNNRQWPDVKNLLKQYTVSAELHPVTASESILSDFEFNLRIPNRQDKDVDIILRLKDIEGSINNLFSKINNPVKDGVRSPYPEESIYTEGFGTDKFITIDSRELMGENGRVVSVDYNMYNVTQLLDRIYLEMLNPSVRPFTYLTDWILKDRYSNRIFDNIGDKSLFIQQQLESIGTDYDDRSLKDVGIRPGMNLIIAKP